MVREKRTRAQDATANVGLSCNGSTITKKGCDVKNETLQKVVFRVWLERYDEKLAQAKPNLAGRVGRLARALLQGENPATIEYLAIEVAANALRIFEQKEETSSTIWPATANMLSAEIKRARAKFPKNDLMLAALTEEMGELAEAESREDIAREALHVACVAVRIAEEGDATFDNASEESKQK